MAGQCIIGRNREKELFSLKRFIRKVDSSFTLYRVRGFDRIEFGKYYLEHEMITVDAIERHVFECLALINSVTISEEFQSHTEAILYLNESQVYSEVPATLKYEVINRVYNNFRETIAIGLKSLRT